MLKPDEIPFGEIPEALRYRKTLDVTGLSYHAKPLYWANEEIHGPLTVEIFHTTETYKNMTWEQKDTIDEHIAARDCKWLIIQSERENNREEFIAKRVHLGRECGVSQYRAKGFEKLSDLPSNPNRGILCHESICLETGVFKTLPVHTSPLLQMVDHYHPRPGEVISFLKEVKIFVEE